MSQTPTPLNSQEISHSRVLLTKMLLNSLVVDKSPLSALDPLKPRLREMTGSLARLVRENGAGVTRLRQGAAMAVGSSMVYWLAFYTGLAAPGVGFIICLLASAGISTSYGWIVMARRNFEWIQLYYSCLLLLQNADQKITAQEKKIMDGFLATLDLKAAEKEALLKTTVSIPRELPVPSWMDFEQKRAILSGSWSLVYSDGVDDSETRLFEEIGIRFGFSPDDLKKIKVETVQIIDAMEAHALLLASVVRSWVAPKGERDEVILDILSALSVKAESRNTLEKSFSAFNTENPSVDLLMRDVITREDVLASLYTFGRGVLDPALEESPLFATRFQGLCREAGKEQEGLRFQQLIDELYNGFEAQLTSPGI